MTKRTERKKQALWQQRCGDNLLASLQLTGVSLALGAYNPGLPHLCSLHHALYMDVLPDAGELRTVDIQLFDIPCCHFEYLESQGNALMATLEEDMPLEMRSAHELAAHLAWFYAELSVLAPFRCGNDRASRLFLEQLIIHAGYDVQWGKSSQPEWLHALQKGMVGDIAPMTVIFDKVIAIPG